MFVQALPPSRSHSESDMLFRSLAKSRNNKIYFCLSLPCCTADFFTCSPSSQRLSAQISLDFIGHRLRTIVRELNFSHSRSISFRLLKSVHVVRPNMARAASKPSKSKLLASKCALDGLIDFLRLFSISRTRQRSLYVACGVSEQEEEVDEVNLMAIRKGPLRANLQLLDAQIVHLHCTGHKTTACSINCKVIKHK